MARDHDAISIIVHGGAWDIPVEERRAHTDGCEQAAQRGARVLRDGGSSVDAVQAAVTDMEDDPTFDAGFGAFLNLDGVVELDASIMDGASLEAGAVAAVTDVKNPVALARRVMDTGDVLLVAGGASRFADEVGHPRCDPASLVSPRELERWRDLSTRDADPSEFFGMARGTVGAVARDGDGHIAAATSTGGRPLDRPGRVGDTPLVGSGVYADDGLAGASSTGFGEAIIKVVLCHRAARLAEAHDAQQACDLALRDLERLRANAGLIMIDRHGNLGFARSTPAMAVAYVHGDGPPQSAL